jgi:DNA-binding XRE family transcriptional regulator
MIDLQKVRQEAGLTQEHLAEKVGVIRQTISNIECGIAKPSINLAKAISEVLKINWVDFFTESEGE